MLRGWASRRAFSSVPVTADAVIIGGGSMGASTLYHLAKQGLTNIVLLEKHQLTSGTTWHSAGLLWHLYGGETEIHLAKHTRNLVETELPDLTGDPSCFIRNGGLFVCTTRERYEFQKRIANLGTLFGVEHEDLSTEDITKMHPFVNTDDIYAALYSPADGHIDPNSLVTQYVKGAKLLGGDSVEVIENCPVTGITHENGGVTGVMTPHGLISTSVVVNCAGAWSRKLGAMCGVNVPLFAMRHAYIVTEKIPGIENTPSVRDFNAAVYMKLNGDCLSIGGYEANPIFWDPLDDFSFSLFDLDWDTFMPHYEAHVNRMPVLETIGVQSTVCGPESFTSDHHPLLGEAPELRGFYLGCGFNSSGIMMGGGCGNQLAKWIINGRPNLDMFHYDINRFHSSYTANSQWIQERCHETYATQSRIPWRVDPPLGGRNLRRSPFHEALVKAGCVFTEALGWERPLRFTGNDITIKPYDYGGNYGHQLNTNYEYVNEIRKYYTWDSWECTSDIHDEHMAARQGVVVFDQSAFGKFVVSGSRSKEFMEWLCSNEVATRDIGSVIYTTLCNKNGGIEADLTVTVLEDDRYYIVAAGASAQHDLVHIRKVNFEGGYGCLIEDITDDYGVLGVQGPLSRQVLEGAAPGCKFDNDSFPFSTKQDITISGCKVSALRLTFVGELGWEIHVSLDDAMKVYNAIMNSGKQLGIRLAGYNAMDSLSIEKGYKHWHQDISGAETPLEAGLGFTCKMKTDTDFLGRAALQKQKDSGLKQKLACFTTELCQNHGELQGNEIILRDGIPCGFVRRAEVGHTIGKNVAYGYVRGDKVTLKWLKAGVYTILTSRGTIPATFNGKCVFDPSGERVHI